MAGGEFEKVFNFTGIIEGCNSSPSIFFTISLRFPELLTSDSASEFAATDLNDVLSTLSIGVDPCQPTNTAARNATRNSP
jgi:hypothetical protein